VKTFKGRLLRVIEGMVEAEKLELVVTYTSSSRRDATIMLVMVPDTWKTVARVRLVTDEAGFELYFGRLAGDGTFGGPAAGLHTPIRYQDEPRILEALERVRVGIKP
jgi:hypothetical protein